MHTFGYKRQNLLHMHHVIIYNLIIKPKPRRTPKVEKPCRKIEKNLKTHKCVEIFMFFCDQIWMETKDF